MDTSRLGRGEMIAGVSGVALIFVMFVFDWYSIEGLTGEGVGNAFASFAVIDLILFVTALAAAGLAFATATSRNVGLPVAGSALVTGLGILSLLLVLYRIINAPDVEILGGGDVSLDREFGVWLGLIATAGIAYGGWVGMQEEGTTFSEQADRLQTRDDAPPPPPPPPPAAGGTGAPPVA